MSFEDMMKKLQAEYVSNIINKVGELQELCEKGDCESELENFFHKLKGSGKSYGVPEITTYGEFFEKLLKSGVSFDNELRDGALKLLKSIQEARVQDQAYPLDNCPVFNDLKVKKAA